MTSAAASPSRWVRREVRAATVVAIVVLVVSAIAGVGWGFLAPTQQLLVLRPGRGATLTGESLHQFDALALFVLIGAVSGLLSAVAVWRWRSMRGPLVQLGLLIGSGLGALAMAGVGEQVAKWLHPRPHNPPVGQIVELPTVDSVIDLPAVIGKVSELRIVDIVIDRPEVTAKVSELSTMVSVSALIVQPLIASFVILFLAALSASEDLGTGRRAFGNGGESRSATGILPLSGDTAPEGELPGSGYRPVAEEHSLPEFRPRP
ncbi:DUF2567 domain-containing protein [Nocardia sp. 004]|uniref:DUF2567 domain-containing protein n=1 Tax=Nocardia sp. 004 TaxID=3385978 RepID=UPI0039A34D98